jgi:hypothetical protein
VLLIHSRFKDLAYTMNVSAVCGKTVVYSANGTKSIDMICGLCSGMFKVQEMVHSVTTVFECGQYCIKVF